MRCSKWWFRENIMKTSNKLTKGSLKNKNLKQKLRKEVNQIKINIGGCIACGWFDPDLLEALEFDHIERESKFMEISTMVIRTYNIDKIKQEIDKCQLLCANCHKLRTIEQRGYKPY